MLNKFVLEYSLLLLICTSNRNCQWLAPGSFLLLNLLQSTHQFNSQHFPDLPASLHALYHAVDLTWTRTPNWTLCFPISTSPSSIPRDVGNTVDHGIPLITTPQELPMAIIIKPKPSTAVQEPCMTLSLPASSSPAQTRASSWPLSMRSAPLASRSSQGWLLLSLPAQLNHPGLPHRAASWWPLPT